MQSNAFRSSAARSSAVTAIATLVLGAATLAAHDMWIEPTSFLPDVGQVVGMKLRVGQDLLGDPLVTDAALVNQFIVDGPAGRTPVVRRDGSDPAGLVRVAMPGLLVVGYRSNPSPVAMTADKFNAYLAEEGLDAVAAARARRGESHSPVRELFARCAKSLILSGEGTAATDRSLGFTLELVAERNPYTLQPGQDLPVRLTFENRPLAGALVVAMNRKNPSEKQAMRTDRDGRVRVAVQPDGLWMVKAVHMVPAAAGSQADWASYWASLTFERRSKGPAR